MRGNFAEIDMNLQAPHPSTPIAHLDQVLVAKNLPLISIKWSGTIFSNSGMWRKLCSFYVLSVLLFSFPARAESGARDLGDGLRYFRAKVLPTDLPSSEVKTGPLVLDLRYATGDETAAAELDAWLSFRATEKTPVMLLINADTGMAIRKVLQSKASRPAVITIGRPDEKTDPDVGVETTAEEERRAYDAFEHSKSIEALLVENADKPRLDEASIMRARTEVQDEPVEDNPLDRVAPTETKSEPATPVPIDRALQRAIHLHRALRALKRL